MKKRSLLVYTILTCIVLAIIAISLYVGNNINQQKRMKENPSYAKGVIVKVTGSAKMGPSIHYRFVVDNQLYEGSCLKQRKDLIKIGDSCLVIFAKNDISVNNLYRDNLGNLNLINKNDTLRKVWNMCMDSLIQAKGK